eukprot:5814271-Pyramimonas_sp.AAC.1
MSAPLSWSPPKKGAPADEVGGWRRIATPLPMHRRCTGDASACTGAASVTPGWRKSSRNGTVGALT